jgi:1-acyl-sn-glycerol-3-phosphate acyltransferase
MYYVANILLFLYGMRKDISGTYPFNHSGPCVYVVNHKSYLDVVIIASIVKPQIKYLGKAEVFKWPLFGLIAKHSGQIPVQREDKLSRQRGYDLMKEAIFDDFSIILFPEGGWKNKEDHTSSNPYNLKANQLLHQFRNGAFRLALETKVPVVPIALFNAQERFSDTSMKIIPGKIKLHIFDAIDSNLFKDSLALNEKCFNIMLQEIENYKS